MSTRSAIGMVTWDGRIKAVYCHFDGYIKNGVGEMLCTRYKDIFKVNQLIDGGSISTLGGLIRETKYHAGVEGIEGNEPKLFDTKEEMVSYYKNSWCEYFYLFENDSWTVTQNRYFKKLKEKVIYGK
jgi:hypothetical protein